MYCIPAASIKHFFKDPLKILYSSPQKLSVKTEDAVYTLTTYMYSVKQMHLSIRHKEC